MTARFWAVVPAAGRSRRMAGTAVPKQYLQLAGRSVIEWAIAPLLEHSDCQRVVVVLAEDDRHWQGLSVARNPRILTATGGAERADSVLAGLRALAAHAAEADWVLVHDAARPCLRADDLNRLLGELSGHDVGGLLATPVVDTLKRVDSSDRVVDTVPRDMLWRALTPQMFRYAVLERALRSVTAIPPDEAAAVAALGLQPRVVRGDPENFKITLPEDLERAERLLRSWSGA